MNWVQGMLDDDAIFPSKIGVAFPKNFQATVKSIVRRLFRVYAHLYNHHFAQLCALSIEGKFSPPTGTRATVLTPLVRPVQRTSTRLTATSYCS